MRREGPMKPYKTVSEILELVRDYRRRLSELYHSLEDPKDSKRLAMLLEYMSRHEKLFERSLARFEEDRRSRILGVWFQYVPEDLRFDDVKVGPNQSIAQVVDMALEFDEKLVRFYEHMARNVSDYEETRAFFEALAEQEKQEKAQLEVNAEMIKEL